MTVQEHDDFAIGQRARVRPGYLFAGNVVTITGRITDDPDEPLVIEAVFDPGEDLVLARRDGYVVRLAQDDMYFRPEELEVVR